jgi:hypothetical protein
MRGRSLTALILLVFAAAGAAGAAGADAGGEKGGPEKKVEKRRIVFIGEDGKKQVIEGDGAMVRRGYLGVGLTELTPELRTHFGAPEESGVMISKVDAGSPADKAGLKVGDILTEVDGKAVRSSWDVSAQIRGYSEGQETPLVVWRDGRQQTLTAAVSLRERPEMDMGPWFIRSGDGDDMTLRWNPDLGSGRHLRLAGPDGSEDREVRMLHLRSPREAELEKQLKALEKRLDELEKQLKQRK